MAAKHPQSAPGRKLSILSAGRWRSNAASAIAPCEDDSQAIHRTMEDLADANHCLAEQLHSLKTDYNNLGQSYDTLEVNYSNTLAELERTKRECASLKEQTERLDQRMREMEEAEIEEQRIRRLGTRRESVRRKRREDGGDRGLEVESGLGTLAGVLEGPASKSLASPDTTRLQRTLNSQAAIISALQATLESDRATSSNQIDQLTQSLEYTQQDLAQYRDMYKNLMEENESFQVLIREKTIKGSLRLGSSPSAVSLADELAEMEGTSLGDRATLNETVHGLRAENKALSIYIQRILGRIMENSQLQQVLAQDGEYNTLKKTTATERAQVPQPPRKTSIVARFWSGSGSTTADHTSGAAASSSRAGVATCADTAASPPRK